MTTTQSKLAGYIGVERPAILGALGLPTGDQTGLDQLWEQFAQLAATGTVGEGKALSLVDTLPVTGDENTYYGLTAAIESETAPLTDPVADTPFNAFFTDSPDLSGITLDTPVNITAKGESATIQVSLADTLITDAVSGGSSRFLWLPVESEGLGFVYLAGEVATPAETYPAGWYIAALLDGLPDMAIFQAIDYEGFIKPNTTTLFTLPQEAIDNGFAALFTTFTDYYARGIYGFDGTNYNLQLDLSDFSAEVAMHAIEISSLISRVAALEAWQQQAESAAGAASGGA